MQLIIKAVEHYPVNLLAIILSSKIQNKDRKSLHAKCVHSDCVCSGVIDTTLNALHLHNVHSKSDKIPEINLNLTETADASEVELMANDDNGFERCTEGLNSDSSNDTVLLLDTNFETPNDLPCLQPIPVTATNLGLASAAGIDKDRAESSDSLLNIASQRAAVDSDPSGELPSSHRNRHRHHQHHRPANILQSKPPATKNEPFGFVNDMLASLASPVKKPNRDTANASSASNSVPNSSALNASCTVDPTTIVDSDEDGV